MSSKIWFFLWQRRPLLLAIALLAAALTVLKSRLSSRTAWSGAYGSPGLMGYSAGGSARVRARERDNVEILREGGINMSSYSAPFHCDRRNMPAKFRVRKASSDFTIVLHGSADFVSDAMWNMGVWEESDHNIMTSWAAAIKHVDPSRTTFVDLGANIAAHAMHFVDMGYNVHMFEPTFVNYILLQCSLAMSGVVNPGVRLNTFGLGDRPSEACMMSPANNFGGTQAQAANPGCVPHSKASIGTMDHYYRHIMARNAERVGFMKIDIEGFEIDALNGATEFFASESAPVGVFFEFYPGLHLARQKDPMTMVHYFLDRGYQLYAGDMKTQWAPQNFEDFMKGNEANVNILAVKSHFYLQMLESDYELEGAVIIRAP